MTWTEQDIENAKRKNKDLAERNPASMTPEEKEDAKWRDYDLSDLRKASKIALQSTRKGIETRTGSIQHKREMTESELRENIRDAAIKLGWEFYFTFYSFHSPRGMTDLILCRPPRLIFAELKRDGMELTKYQELWRSLLQQCPQVEYCLWHPSDWFDNSIIETLK